MLIDSFQVLVILISSLGFIPDNETSNILHPMPTGGDSQSAVYEPWAEGAFRITVKEIPLTNSPLMALVDDDIFELVSFLPWRIKSGYAAYTLNRYPQNPITVRLHKIVLPVESGKFVDHFNHNRLDNQRSNLRSCTHPQNCANQLPRAAISKSSRFKGVTWHKRNLKWTSHITVNYVMFSLGSFNSEIDAAKAYNDAAVKYFGEFAYLNQL